MIARLLLFGIAVALAIALPDTTQATSLHEVKKLIASDAQAFAWFGTSVAVSGDTAVVGARFEDAAATNAGAAYVFDLLQPKPAGDANCDGTADDIDAALILQFTAGLLGSLDCQDAADVNGDLEVTSVDAALILQFTAGLVEELPPP